MTEKKAKTKKKPATKKTKKVTPKIRKKDIPKKPEKKKTPKKSYYKKRPKREKTMTAKQKRFVAEFFIDELAHKAAERAGFARSTAWKKAPNWVAKDRRSCPKEYLHVWDAVEERRKKLVAIAEEKSEMKAVEVLTGLAKMARFDIRKLYDPVTGKLKKITDLDDDTAFALASVTFTPTKFGMQIKYKSTSKEKAHELLGKKHNLFNDTLEIVPTGDAMVQVVFVKSDGNGRRKEEPKEEETPKDEKK